jgi:hypothetical protein
MLFGLVADHRYSRHMSLARLRTAHPAATAVAGASEATRFSGRADYTEPGSATALPNTME